MVVLATRVYVEGEARERALDSLDALVENALEGLSAHDVVETDGDQWRLV